MRKLLSLLLTVLLLLTMGGCGTAAAQKQMYQITWIDIFDTVTTMKSYAGSQEEFQALAEEVHDGLMNMHRLFDIYNDFEGISNLKTVNDAAGGEPVAVDSLIIDLLEDCRDFYTLTGGRVNAAAGSVLRLWHEARTAGLADPENAALPDMELLTAAAEHMSFDTVIIDRENGTVQITDPEQSLDVGAIAKGWAAQKILDLLPESTMISLGGNVCAVGAKPDGTAWNIAVQSPLDLTKYLGTISLVNTNAVTSGDYQRCYTVDGVSYHHIIDLDTLMPGTLWRSVTVLCGDAGLADCLSTALFLMPLEEGTALAGQCGAEVLWVDADGGLYATDGFGAN